ncbi:MAG: Hsp20/alpha crystallin family protein [Gammaproteobacteria bacterium]|nr:Hsp20/alpha crystallin family protein [Gammaproteobacteria bacterium]
MAEERKPSSTTQSTSTKTPGTQTSGTSMQGGQGQQSGEMQRTSAFRAMSPLDEMDRLMDRMLESVMPRSLFRPLRWDMPEVSRMETRMPRVDVIDRDEALVIRAEVPGVQKKDLDVSITDNAVTIKASMEQQQEEEEGDYHRRELLRGMFFRTIPLPIEVDSDRPTASFNNGILELTLPKTATAKKRHLKIE